MLAGVMLASALALRPARVAGDYPDASSAADAMLGGDGSAQARARVREHLEWIAPEAVVRRLADLGYRVEVNEHPRDGHWGVSAEMDYHGGFARTGLAPLLVVSEKIRDPATGRWFANAEIDQSIDHEIGHALDADVSGSASPEFARAWEADFAEIPVELKTSYAHDGRFNQFRYFVYADGGYERARHETFAESYAVLLRGDAARSREAFRRYFPRSLSAAGRILESRYGRLFRPDQEPVRPEDSNPRP